MTDIDFLTRMGWGPFFAAQVTDPAQGAPMRVAVVHRHAVDLIGPEGVMRARPGLDNLAVGDWVLAKDGEVLRLLERKTLLQRQAAGTGKDGQLIAANVDTAFIVTSCNADFNVARLERYLAMAAGAGILPVIVLTKADACDDPRSYLREAEALAPMLAVEAVNALDPREVDRLRVWCGPGRTLALLGSSGVGKSTLINGLTGIDLATGAIREDDARGRHTTTVRSLHAVPGGGWLIDTPGMRELRLSGGAEGVAAVFADLEERAAACRFQDCAHETEPGCAVQAAITAGEIDPARFARWQKLRREDEFHTQSLVERASKDRAFGKMKKRVMKAKQGRKG